MNYRTVRSSVKLYFIWLVAGLIAFTTGIQAQDQLKILDYKRDLKQADDILRFDLLCKISFEYRNSFPDSTIWYGNQAYNLGEKLKLEKGLARPVSFIAIGYSAKGDLANSFSYHDQAITIAIRQKDSVQVGYAHNNLGRILLEVKDFKRAEENFKSALQIFEALRERSGTAYALRSLSEVRAAGNDLKGALELLEQSYQIRKSAGDKRAVISALLESAAVYRKLNDSAGAEKKLNEALERSLDVPDKETQAEVLMALIDFNLYAGSYPKITELLRTAEKIIEKLDNELLRLKFFVLTGKVFLKTERIKEAAAVWLKARLLAEKINNPVIEKDIIFDLLKIRPAENNASLLLRLSEVEEEINQREMTRGTEKLDLQLLVQKSEFEKQQLKLILAEEKLFAERQRSDNMALKVLIGTFFAGAMLAVLFLLKQRVLNRRLMRQNDTILRNKAEIDSANNLLEIQNRELKELSAEKDSLMGIVAHDLRTPLSHISGFARLIQMEGSLSKVQNEYIERISKTVEHGILLVNDLLNINNYKSAEYKPQAGQISLREFSETISRNFAKSAADKNINLEINLSEESLIKTDPVLLSRIAENLLSNGLKFSPKGGFVRLDISSTPKELVLIFSDSGPGFAEEDISGMFRQFKKLSARPTAGEPSNGLGLAIVKNIAEKLGGSIELLSKPGQSAIFRVIIPAASA